MKLPQLHTWLRKDTGGDQEVYLSLLLDVWTISVSAWTIRKGVPYTVASASASVKEDSWEHRTERIDKTISKIDELIGQDTITKVLYGLSQAYLTQDGNIEKSAKHHLKELSKKLALQVVGFVPLHESIAYTYKKKEGIPLTSILLGVSGTSCFVHIYKVGKVIAFQQIETARVQEELVGFFQHISADDVLPSRMILYGANEDTLEDLKAGFMRYPWKTHVNMLHVPRITITSKHQYRDSVAQAGLGVVTQTPSVFDDEQKNVRNESRQSHVSGLSAEETMRDETVHHLHPSSHAESHGSEKMDEEDEADTESQQEQADESEKLSNVRLVHPETLGFSRSGQHQKQPASPKDSLENRSEPEEVPKKRGVFEKLPRFDAARLRVFSGIKTRMLVPLIAGVIVLAVAIGMFAFVLPSAEIRIIVKKHPIDTSLTVSLDTSGKVDEGSGGLIPAEELTKTVTGEKTVTATGTKEVGTAAKGSVTIYNKSATTRTFEEGTVLSAGSLEFTLDTDVSVASASENLVSGTVTFGKASVSVSAGQIGEKGNISSGSEFSIRGVSDSIAVARNDDDFSGGTSKEVTVVSKNDQDALVKALTKELVEQARSELESSVSGGQVLILDTVKTRTTEQSYEQELGEEAKELTGKLTVEVTGVAYREDDFRRFVENQARESAPSSYALDPTTVSWEVTKTDVQDEDITLSVTVKGSAAPDMDYPSLIASVRGKSQEEAVSIIKSVNGVEDVSVRTSWSLFSGKLPTRSSRIRVVTGEGQQ